MGRSCPCQQRDRLLMSSMQDFIVSRVRAKLLKTFLSSPTELFYIRQLTRVIDEEINAVRRELIHLSKAGILKSQARGNRTYYWGNNDYRYFSELTVMVAKTVGLGAAIIKSKEKLGNIKFACLSGRFVRKMPVLDRQVDLLIIGEVVMPQLAALVKFEEPQVGREINYSVMSVEELTFRKRRRDPFILDLLTGSRIMLIGDEEELIA